MRIEAQVTQINETAYQFNKRHPHPPAHRWLIEDNGSIARTTIGLCKRDGCGKRKRFVKAIEDLPDFREPSVSKRDRVAQEEHDQIAQLLSRVSAD